MNDKAFIILFNPTDQPITRNIKIPLYYTGLDKTASVAEKDSLKKLMSLDASAYLSLQVSIPANGYNWYLVRK